MKQLLITCNDGVDESICPWIRMFKRVFFILFVACLPAFPLRAQTTIDLTLATGIRNVEANPTVTCAIGLDYIWADPTDHRWKMCNNNGASTDVAGLSDFAHPPAIGNVTPSAGTFTSVVGTTANFSITTSSTYKSAATNPALSGTIQLGSADSICLRNNANSADLCISKSAGDVFSLPALFLASPPAIGGTTPNAGTFNALTIAGLSSGCLQNTSGAVSSTGGSCGSFTIYLNNNTPLAAPHIVMGSGIALSGTTGVTFTSTQKFTSSSTYVCTANSSAGTGAIEVTNVSGTQVNLTSSAGSDTVSISCTGN